MEPFRGKHPPGIPNDKDPCDKGKQTKLKCRPEWLGPFGFFVRTIDWNGEGEPKLRNSSDIPGTRSEGARQEVAGVVHEVSDNHVDDLLGEPGGGGRTFGRGNWRGTPKKSLLDSGSTSVPDAHGKQFDRCSGKQQSTIGGTVEVPDSEDVGVFVGIVLLQGSR